MFSIPCHFVFVIRSKEVEKSNFRQYDKMEKQRMAEPENRQEKKILDQRRESQKKQDPGAQKVRKVAKQCAFQ